MPESRRKRLMHQQFNMQSSLIERNTCKVWQHVEMNGNDMQTKRCKTHPKTVLAPLFGLFSENRSCSMHPWAMALTSSKALKLLNNPSGQMKPCEAL